VGLLHLLVFAISFMVLHSWALYFVDGDFVWGLVYLVYNLCSPFIAH
jgi:hypothetical protein